MADPLVKKLKIGYSQNLSTSKKPTIWYIHNYGWSKVQDDNIGYFSVIFQLDTRLVPIMILKLPIMLWSNTPEF